MSITKALVVKPCPCPFCGEVELELRAVMFRHWHIHCLNTDCICKGPEGKTPDKAISKWNSLTQSCVSQRQDLAQFEKDYQNPEVPKKIWKAIRAFRTSTIKKVARITECHPKTIKKYLLLLEENGYVRFEQQHDNGEARKAFRCIKSSTVKAPSWLSLQLSPREYQVYKNEKKSLKWNKVQATSNNL